MRTRQIIKTFILSVIVLTASVSLSLAKETSKGKRLKPTYPTKSKPPSWAKGLEFRVESGPKLKSISGPQIPFTLTVTNDTGKGVTLESMRLGLAFQERNWLEPPRTWRVQAKVLTRAETPPVARPSAGPRNGLERPTMMVGYSDRVSIASGESKTLDFVARPYTLDRDPYPSPYGMRVRSAFLTTIRGVWTMLELPRFLFRRGR